MKQVNDVYGNSVIVDDDNARIYSYKNRERRVERCAEIYIEGKATGQWTNYVEEGMVDSVMDRITTWNNVLLLAYARAVDFCDQNTGDQKLFHSFVSYVKENESLFFDEYGDFRSDMKYDAVQEQLQRMGVLVDERDPDNKLHEVECIPLANYCAKTGKSDRDCRRLLEKGDLEGMKIGGDWFVADGDTNGLFILKSPVPEGYVKVDEYCKLHQIDLRNTRRKLADGIMPGVKIGRLWFVSKDLPYVDHRRKDLV